MKTLKPAHTLAELAAITLSHGAHADREKGMCVNEALAWYAGEKHSDRPKCQSAVIGTLSMRYNDRLKTDAERATYLRDLIPVMMGTATTKADETTRAYMVADWLIRLRTPIWLRVGGFEAEAQSLEALPTIVDAATARAARAVTVPLRDKLWAVRSERRAKLAEKFSAASDASAAIDAIAASAAIAASDAIAASAASDASDASAAIDASAASDAIAASAAIAASDAIAASSPSGVHTDAFTAALKAAQETKGDYWTKRNAAYTAARQVYDARLEELPIIQKVRDETERMRLSLVQLIRDLCAVGRAA